MVDLWFGLKKPMPNILLKPLHDPLKEVYRGMDLEISNSSNKVRLRGIVLYGTCDLPVKAIFLNMNQFNGKFGCQVCK